MPPARGSRCEGHPAERSFHQDRSQRRPGSRQPQPRRGTRGVRTIRRALLQPRSFGWGFLPRPWIFRQRALPTLATRRSREARFQMEPSVGPFSLGALGSHGAQHRRGPAQPVPALHGPDLFPLRRAPMRRRVLLFRHLHLQRCRERASRHPLAAFHSIQRTAVRRTSTLRSSGPKPSGIHAGTFSIPMLARWTQRTCALNRAEPPQNALWRPSPSGSAHSTRSLKTATEAIFRTSLNILFL